MCSGRLHEGDYFDGHSKSDAAFLQDTDYTGVLDEQRRLIHRAIRQVPKLEVIVNKLKEAFAEPPTLDELSKARQKTKTNT